MSDVISKLSVWMIPVLVASILVHAYRAKINIFSSFVEGAAEAVDVVIKILPYITAIYFALDIFQRSGALSLVLSPIRGFFRSVHLPEEVVPLMVIRPLSGPAAMAVVLRLMERYGPDSLIGYMAATIEGTSDTTMYIATVYYGSVGVENPRYSILVGLTSDLIGFATAVAICNLLYTG